ncbi:MAG: cytochrome b/b6 domain-containing protein [Terracidiphilus sp.]|nr:cytochrome b/b6 domain-containing protein [Terracidiphilus sp.]
MPAASQAERTRTLRHSGVVRVTHWLTFVAFVALFVTGSLIVISHPRFYWGEVGNVNTKPLFVIPIPSSRDTVPNGYNYEMPDENGWSRALHFEAAWVVVLAGLVYGIYGLGSGHFKNLIPARRDWTWRAYRDRIQKYLRRAPPDQAEARSYNVLQRTAYVIVIFVLFPLMIWTGLAMSPSFTAAFPVTVELLGGRQSARTIHFIVSWLLLLFLFVHVAMVALSGFRSRMRAMITGYTRDREEAP